MLFMHPQIFPQTAMEWYLATQFQYYAETPSTFNKDKDGHPTLYMYIHVDVLLHMLRSHTVFLHFDVFFFGQETQTGIVKFIYHPPTHPPTHPPQLRRVFLYDDKP